MERPLPTHVLAHLSDLHLTGDGSPVGGVADARESRIVIGDVVVRHVADPTASLRPPPGSRRRRPPARPPRGPW